jgi:ketosteroid isomerase-like protein
MFKKSIPVLLGIAMVGLVACTQGKTDHSASAPIDYAGLEQEIREVFDMSRQLFQNKDVGGLVDRFTEDGVLKLPGRPAVVGHEALRLSYEGTVMLENFELAIKPYVIKISENGDMAYVLAEYAVAFDTPEGLFYEHGISQITFLHVGGRWKIAAENLSPITKPNDKDS